MKLRVLIVDDEQLALSRLRRLLEQLPEVEVVASIDSAKDAVAAIRRLHPDLVLLDIEMPQMDGFDVVEALASGGATQANLPLVAFVTAYRDFALEAFDTGALDFICKPVRLPRLEKLIGRAGRAITARDAAKRLSELRSNLGQLRETTAHVQERHLWVRNRGELLRVATIDVDWVEAQACYVNLHLADRSYLVRNAIGSMTDELRDHGFVRVHKSALVNRSKVVSIKRNGAGQLRLILSNGAEIRVGRKYRDAVQTISAPAIAEIGQLQP